MEEINIITLKMIINFVYAMKYSMKVSNVQDVHFMLFKLEVFINYYFTDNNIVIYADIKNLKTGGPLGEGLVEPAPGRPSPGPSMGNEVLLRCRVPAHPGARIGTITTGILHREAWEAGGHWQGTYSGPESGASVLNMAECPGVQ
jgi:hypothetical protein